MLYMLKSKRSLLFENKQPGGYSAVSEEIRRLMNIPTEDFDGIAKTKTTFVYHGS